MKIVFKNGHVYTMNREMPYVSAVVVEDDKIVYVGNDEGAGTHEDGAKVIDLDGKMLIPGMIDAHCHPIASAFFTSGFMCDAEMSHEDCLEVIKQYIAENPDKEVYYGMGYPEWVFDERGPRKEELDAICPDKPIFILSNGIHEAWCNSKTLEILDIEHAADPMPGKSYFRRDEKGELTGNIIEIAAEEVIMSQLPLFDPEVVTANYHEVFDLYASLGVTGFMDCGASGAMGPKGIAFMDKFEKAGELKQRFSGCVMVEDGQHWKTAVDELVEQHKEHHSDMYNINTLKLVNDGTVESCTAAMNEPYVDGTVAESTIIGEELYSQCLKAAALGFNIHIHGIGSKTIHETLMAAKAVREAGYFDTRIINAHTHVTAAEDIPLFGKYNVLANTSSIWHYDAPEAETVLGNYRYTHQFQMQSILEHGARMTLGSDFPADEMGNEPLKGIQMGVTRQLFLDDNAPILKPESERLTVQQCLEAYTINAAYGMHMDDKIGSIEVGKYADLVVLEKDLNEIDPHEIMNTPVLLTMLNGKPTYSSGEMALKF